MPTALVDLWDRLLHRAILAVSQQVSAANEEYGLVIVSARYGFPGGPSKDVTSILQQMVSAEKNKKKKKKNSIA